MITWLSANTPFPPVEKALVEPNGLLAAGGDLSASRLLAAYRSGIFPWYSEGQPILWWSPDPRMVLEVDQFTIPRSLRKRVRQNRFDIRSDTAFRSVVNSCATTPRSGQYGTWITPQMIDAYDDLHDRGYAHSIEAWRAGELVGGLYGLALGGVFFGESMFSHESDASKVALVALVALLRQREVQMIDCQQETAHLASFGARPIPRAQFAARLSTLIDLSGTCRSWPQGLVSDFS
jgi:leucyl/phenylalanyl-tRNA--protein transferase